MMLSTCCRVRRSEISWMCATTAAAATVVATATRMTGTTASCRHSLGGVAERGVGEDGGHGFADGPPLWLFYQVACLL